jgi:lipopolysaccharide export system permease protein
MDLAVSLVRVQGRAMKTVRKLLFREVFLAVMSVTLAFVSLFFFFDFVDELQAVSSNNMIGYSVAQALVYVALMVPSHVYELLPITVLIGTIFVMARLANSSEFTILRTSGLGPWSALRLLLGMGLVFVVLTFAVGDYMAPFADKTAQLLKAKFQGRISVGKTGAWIKERQPYSSFSVNVAALASDASLRGVRIFELNNRGEIVSLTEAASGTFGPGDSWALKDVQRTEFEVPDKGPARAVTTRQADFAWPNKLSAEMVSAAVLRPDRMGTIDLFQYTRHLRNNGQSAQKYEIQFWKKLFYPLSCLVMVMLALPFAYLHFRSGSTTSMVFGGVMAGISFVLLNNVLGDVGYLQGWQPWLTAALPGLIYSFFSLSAFGWLVLRR